MKTTPLPSQDELNSLLEYDPETGTLIWKKRDASMFTEGERGALWSANRWNSLYAGKEAFTSINRHGYRRGTLKMKNYLAHRLIWKMVHGEDPVDIDHIDGDRLNNRIANLRSVSRRTNLQNTRLRDGNGKGAHGIAFIKRTGRYTVTIYVGGKCTYVGNFRNLEDAVSARKAAEIKHGYHENHGRAA